MLCNGDTAKSTVVQLAMELRHLRYFIAVAEEGHITQAAELLDMQQPPLQPADQGDGARARRAAFLPKGKGVELTDAGRT